ncbi:MAG: ThuA domain-containing protein [Bacteroidota bacterium]
MKSRIAIIVLCCLALSCTRQKDKVLVFSKTKGYRHESIETGKQAIIDLGKKNNFDVDTTENAAHFNEDNLKNYKTVIFLNTTLDVLDPVQQGDFKRFFEAGGGFVGIHAAADTEYGWPWYGELVGAYFRSHPEIQEARFKKVSTSPLVASLPEEWKRTDELYNFKKISNKINVLVNLDETSYKGGENGENHPIAWYHEYEGGRSFYTGLGHTKESYSEPLFLAHLLKGIQYAIGDAKLDYDKVKSKRVPEENRFTKTVLDFNLNEPTEMAVLPDGRIIFTERKGDIKLYSPVDGKVKVINSFAVGTKFEDGVIGIAADPKFIDNHWIYIFYAHPERTANVVSRFELKDDKIDQTSEKILIEVVTQRDQCCHTGGSLLFDQKGNLFISTGDNTSPFESDGYSPSDERPGRAPFDAQKSSSNTNDLRGKILRIHPEPDGTYTIPEGNLFPKGEPNTRPEIYVMGTRNPYRISLDERTGFLYWGEVGPDAGESDSLRGPRGYDEVNQARKAGFFGWPYFVGNNYAYAKYDFTAKKAGPFWDPARPINESPNNTGKRELPPVAPAFIFYPYGESEEFPMVKTGSRNAMAGPVYYSDNFKNAPAAFPDYFDGKLIIYDWMRNWMFLVTMNESGDIKDIEPFMENTKFNNIIDMSFGPDGKLYLLEYGTQWFKQNLDARLVRIDFNGGNRPPVATLAADKLSGALPLAVTFNTKGTNDPDGDKLKYELVIDGKTQTSEDGNFTFTFDKPGVYSPEFKVTDEKGASTSAKLQIIAGNAPPTAKAMITRGNKTFFFAGAPVQYAVEVNDIEDGTTKDGKIKDEDVTVTFNYLKGFDMTGIAQGHQKPSLELPGKALMDKSDCKSCHLIDQKSAGPSYLDVANRYKTKEGARDELAAKVIKGGAGVWGTTEMAAHPQISVDDAKKMIDYILSLGEQRAEVKKLPLTGTVIPGNETDGAYLLTVTYYDKRVNNLPSIPVSETLVLRSAQLKPDQASELKVARVIRYENQVGLENVKHNSYAVYKDIDLSGIKRAILSGFIDPAQTIGGEIEMRLDQPDGKLIGKAKLSNPGISSVPTTLEPVEGNHDLYLVFTNETAGDKNLFYFGGAKLENK